MASEAEKAIKPEKKLARIPQPPEKFLLVNMLDLSAATPVQDMVRPAREYGPIYRMVFRGRVVLVVSGHELVNELSDESRFDKTIRGALGLVRRFAGDSFFTAKTPIIMVGPGTGIAPFRGFLQERAALKAHGQEIGQSILFFGCRHPQQDFIDEDELRRFEMQGVTKLSTSFSRVKGEPKCYVQNEIDVRRDEVWQLLEAGATVYVCGDASRMAPDVARTFAAIFSEKTGANSVEAELWLNEITAQNRYLVDVWSSN